MNKSEAQKAIKETARAVVDSKQPQGPQMVLSGVRVEQQMTAGPLPPPETLKRYNDAITNGAERIMVMAEKEQTHHHQLEKQMMKLVLLGQVGGFCICTFSIGGALYLVMHNKSIEAFFSFFSGLALLVGGGYLARQKGKREPSSSEPEKRNKSK